MGKPNPLDMATGLGLGINIIGGFIGAANAKKLKQEAEREARRLKSKLKNLEDNRQEITNPYGGYENLSGLAENLSGMITNPYANLGVATQAAEIQIEQADISLANTLDTLRASGSSAGGATALAQAALQSKKGVAASIETQEAQNEKLRAQGESQMEQLKMSESQRIQGVQISEGQRMQQGEAAGNIFTFDATEDRENAAIDRVAGQLDNANAQAAQSSMDQTSAITGALGGATSVLGSYMQAKASQGSQGPQGEEGYYDSVFPD
jgi:hypothetical protein